jgi:integrase
VRGNVYKRESKTGGPGSWSVRFDTGRDSVTNKRKQVTKGGFRTRREAETWLRDQLGRLDRGEYVKPSRATYGEFLAAWLPAIRSTVRASTWESYERNIRRHLVPRLGHLPLQRLGPEHLNAVYAELLQGGRLDGSGGLSVRSVAYLHTIVHRSLRDAVRWGKVTRNVADAADPPKGKAGKEMTTWTAAQLSVFLHGLEGDRLEVAILLGATTGMRRGEVLGLRWSDVDLDAGRLAVRQTLSAPRNPDTGQHVPVYGEPKTRRGRRSVPLPAQTVAALRAHRLGQKKEQRWGGSGWQDHGLVFCEPDGSPIHPDRFRKRFEHRVARSGLPLIRFHDLRHTYATLALQAGVHAKVVSEILGHASIGITLDTYSHAVPGLQESAAETVAALVFGGA